jgi:hypothetical protein
LCIHRKMASSDVKLSEGFEKPSEGSERPGEQSLHLYVTEGQKPKAADGQPGRGCHVGGYTWRHLIGSPKSSYVM